MRSTFSKRVRTLGTRLVRKWSEQDENWYELDAIPPLWASIEPESIAEGPGTSWNQFWHLKRLLKNKNKGFWGLGGRGGGSSLVPYFPTIRSSVFSSVGCVRCEDFKVRPCSSRSMCEIQNRLCNKALGRCWQGSHRWKHMVLHGIEQKDAEVQILKNNHLTPREVPGRV